MFKLYYFGNIDVIVLCDKDKYVEVYGGVFIIKLNSIFVYIVKVFVFKKGILKKSSSEIMKWRLYDFVENLFCNESVESDIED